jgi:glycerol-3-phosphate dehydrogenase (NAD(P)+)
LPEPVLTEHGLSEHALPEHVVLVGDGQMSLVLADLLAVRRVKTTILSPFEAEAARLGSTRTSVRLPNFRLDPAVVVTCDAAHLASASLVVCAIPTQFIRATFARVGASIPSGVPVVSVAKGIEADTFRLPCDILDETLNRNRAKPSPIAALSGPTIAAELARRLPAALVAASPDSALAASLQATFTSPWTRIYQSNDLIGVELAGACKNVIAIAAGVIDGMALGMNTKSALLARGLAEIARVGVALGGRLETFFGITGVGDLATTCFAPEGRNRSFGEALARGESPEAILARMTSVVEGVPTSRALVRVALEHGIEVPICEAVAAMVYDGLDPREALRQLMSRATGTERIG